MSLRRRAAVAGTAAVLGAGLVGVLGLPLAGPAVAGNPLEEAGAAAQQLAFTGRLRIEWVDARGRQSTEVDVSSGRGELQINGPSPLVATANERYILGSNGWSVLGPGDPSVLGPFPDLSRKYQVHAAPGAPILGRNTDEIDLVLRGRTAERIFLDHTTRLLLRREQFDSDGEVVRVVSFIRLLFGVAPTPALPPGKAKRRSVSRINPSLLPGPYVAPASLDGGYQRMAILAAFDGIQVVYSDGLRSLSVFERTGGLDTRQLPPGGEPVRVRGWPGLRYDWPGGQIVVWEARGSTFTVVADAPAGEVLAALRDMPSGRRPGPLQRLRRACRRVVEAVSGNW